MSATHVLLITLIFMLIFWLAGKHLSGTWKPVVQFISGAVIVVVIVLFLLGLLGARLP